MSVFPPSPETQAVAAEVRAAMARQKVTQSELAARLGMTQQALSRRVSGAKPFEVDVLMKVAITLGVPVATLPGRQTAGAAPFQHQEYQRNNTGYSRPVRGMLPQPRRATVAA